MKRRKIYANIHCAYCGHSPLVWDYDAQEYRCESCGKIDDREYEDVSDEEGYDDAFYEQTMFEDNED